MSDQVLVYVDIDGEPVDVGIAVEETFEGQRERLRSGAEASS